MEKKVIKTNDISVRFGGRNFSDDDFEVNAGVMMLDEKNKIPTVEDVVWYQNLMHIKDSVKMSRYDSIDYSTISYDEEFVDIQLDKISNNIKKLAFFVTVYDGRARNQNLKRAGEFFVRVLNSNNQELIKYNYESSQEGISMIVGTLERFGGEWIYNSVKEEFDEEGVKFLQGFLKE